MNCTMTFVIHAAFDGAQGFSRPLFGRGRVASGGGAHPCASENSLRSTIMGPRDADN